MDHVLSKFKSRSYIWSSENFYELIKSKSWGNVDRIWIWTSKDMIQILGFPELSYNHNYVVLFCKLKNSKNMNFIFCKLKKPQKTWISFFASLKTQKTWISFFCKLQIPQKAWISFFFFCKLKIPQKTRFWKYEQEIEESEVSLCIYTSATKKVKRYTEQSAIYPWHKFTSWFEFCVPINFSSFYTYLFL